ncbi:C45 family peptidase [Pseudomonas batumici]|uniref:C45 family peptidase n=1 Tax=Pseudomonas batumici TaxID=226910 RepID=UPI0030CD110A
MSLARLNLAGSNYEIGYGLGVFGRTAVENHLRPHALWRHLAGLVGTPTAIRMRGLVQTAFPSYWQEIEGLAAGLQLPVEEVFLWNCRGDFVNPSSVDGCTTVFCPTPGGSLIAHNEDGLPQLQGHCAILSTSPDTGLAFTSFVYPGSIPGHTFAVNERGLVATVNNIRPATIPVGMPRQILGRATLDATTLDEALAVVSQPGRAGAFHHTFGQLGSTRLVSVEATAEGVAVIEIEQPAGHSNHLIGEPLSQVPQRITGSSSARQHRVDQHLSQSTTALSPEKALAILRDESDRDLPVYRCAADDPDDENTLATALFSIGASTVEWRVYIRRETDAPDIEGVVPAFHS